MILHARKWESQSDAAYHARTDYRRCGTSLPQLSSGPLGSSMKAATISNMTHSNFLKRFNIQISVNDAQRRFINRVENQIFENFFQQDIEEKIVRSEILWKVAHELGEAYDWDKWFSSYYKLNYLPCLHTLEVSYSALKTKKQRTELSSLINFVLKSSEIDLGITWKDGIFVPKGALILNEGLVNENLKWLSEKKYENVYKPFEKAIRHYLEMTKQPELGFDVITDMYEALEALSKIVTKRPQKDLSANAEQFIQVLNVSTGYKDILKEYIRYANSFRHGLSDSSGRKHLQNSEVESFFYLTGLFIRLAVNNATA